MEAQVHSGAVRGVRGACAGDIPLDGLHDLRFFKIQVSLAGLVYGGVHVAEVVRRADGVEDVVLSAMQTD